MALTQQEQTFVDSITQTVEVLSTAIEQLEELRSTYFDRGYNNGGAAEIDDTDLAGEHISAADLASAINLTTALIALRDNQAVTQDAWGVVINRVRRLS